MNRFHTHYGVAAAAVAAALFFVACTSQYLSNGPGNGEATVTLSSAVTGTFTGTVVCLWDGSTNTGSFAINFASPSPLAALDIDMTQPGQPTVSTWTETTAGAKSAMLVQEPGTVPPSWVMAVGATTPDQGAYSLSLTSVSILTDAGTSKAYTVHGTLNATLPAQSGTGSTGTVTLYGTF
jgi:hypothetical protein